MPATRVRFLLWVIVDLFLKHKRDTALGFSRHRKIKRMKKSLSIKKGKREKEEKESKAIESEIPLFSPDAQNVDFPSQKGEGRLFLRIKKK
jgi:hypothetical protein